MTVHMPLQLKSVGIIKVMLYFILFERLLESFGIPHSVIFLLDIGYFLLFLNLLLVSPRIQLKLDAVLLLQLVLLLLGVTVSIINRVQLLLVIWSLRNLFRFLIFYVACKCFVSFTDTQEIYARLEQVFYISLLILLVQYVAGYRGDFLGGIFGITNGANAYCNVFFITILSYKTVQWFLCKTSDLSFSLMLFSVLLVAAIAEIKILFVEVVAIFAIVFVLTCINGIQKRMLIRIAIFSVLGAIALIISIQVMESLYPNFANFFTIDQLRYHLTRESGYSDSGDLNRLTAIRTINQRIFHDSPWHQWFGMGLGSTEYSSVSFLTSSFYKDYRNLHYYWFSHAWMYLECGYIGLILYISSFILYGFSGVCSMKRYRTFCLNPIFLMTGITVSLLTVILYLYNQSLRLEIAYVLYFCFATMRVGERSNASHALS